MAGDHIANERLAREKRRAKFDIQLDRHEAKYIIPRSMVPEIVEFITPFCELDSHCHGDPPEYSITTLQLDTPNMALHHAKENEAVHRFKLRVRTYNEPGSAPVFMEVKRKVKGINIKSRTMVPFDAWSRDLMVAPTISLDFKTDRDAEGFLQFRRLVMELGARPVVLIRYIRQSFFGKNDSYARISFDRNLCYQPTTQWDDWGRSGRWMPMDTPLAQRKTMHFSGIVLELKTLSDAPHWMIDLVRHFGLERTGNCKYSSAIWQESIFRGTPMQPAYAEELSF